MKLLDYFGLRKKEAVFEHRNVVILNDDEVALTPQLRDWVLRCAIEDADLRILVGQKLGTRTFETVGHLNAALRDWASAILNRGDKKAERLGAVIDTYLCRVARNKTAYVPSRTGLRDGGFWPNPTEPSNNRSIYAEFPYAKKHPFIDQSTPISSAGSCFAVEIAHRLQAEGYNYIIAERNRAGATSTDDNAPVDASASWGIIFNTPSFRQLVEKSFGIRILPKVLWSYAPKQDGREVFMDPFREHIEFNNAQEYLEDYSGHLIASRFALTNAKVFIITLGLNEVWHFKMDGSVFSRSPWRIAPSFVDYKVLTVQENVDELQRMLEVYREFNPDVKIIVSLSPIPLHATFLSDKAHIVEANTHSKAVLRVAAQQFVDSNKDVFYFPSYELIMSGIADPWDDDQRHVKRSAVARVMAMFKEMYVMDQ